MKAVVLGATGATGTDLVNQILSDDYFDEVHIFVRKASDAKHPKLTIHQVDFQNFDTWEHLVNGDVAFSCLGTTLKDAGSKDAQWKVDHDFQFHFAQASAKNNISTFVLISAVGANATSKMFYYKMKGELEESIESLNFPTLYIFQPGLLERKNSKRGGEVFALRLIKLFNKFGLLNHQKPLPTRILAAKMLDSVKNNSELGIFRLQNQDILK